MATAHRWGMAPLAVRTLLAPLLAGMISAYVSHRGTGRNRERELDADCGVAAASGARDQYDRLLFEAPDPLAAREKRSREDGVLEQQADPPAAP